MRFFNRLFNKDNSKNDLNIKSEKNINKGDVSTNTTNNNITNNNTTNHYHLLESTNFSNELNNEIKEKNTRKTEIENLSFDNEDEKIKNIKSIEHMQDIWELKQFTLMSSEEIYQTIKNNNLIEKIIDNQDKRERKKIKDNLRFLEQSNHEEKTALVWMYISSILVEKLNFISLKKYIELIRNKYNLEQNYLEVDSLALFNKFGIFEQSVIKSSSFSPSNKKHVERVYMTDLEEVYNFFPEIKSIYSETNEISNTIQLNSLMPWMTLLSYAGEWLLMDLGLKFKLR